MADLPDDILITIFSFTIGRVDADRLDSATSIEGVCTRWRNVALSVPLLWSWVEVVAGVESHRKRPSLGLQYLQTLMFRSKECLLDIRVWLTPEYERDPIFQELLCHLSRWRHVRVHTERVHPGTFFNQEFITRAENLERVELEILNRESKSLLRMGDDKETMDNGWMQLVQPYLTVLTMLPPHVEFSPLVQHLTRLELWITTAEWTQHTYPFLSACSRVEELVLDILDSNTRLANNAERNRINLWSCRV